MQRRRRQLADAGERARVGPARPEPRRQHAGHRPVLAHADQQSRRRPRSVLRHVEERDAVRQATGRHRHLHDLRPGRLHRANPLVRDPPARRRNRATTARSVCRRCSSADRRIRRAPRRPRTRRRRPAHRASSRWRSSSDPANAPPSQVGRQVTMTGPPPVRQRAAPTSGSRTVSRRSSTRSAPVTALAASRCRTRSAIVGAVTVTHSRCIWSYTKKASSTVRLKRLDTCSSRGGGQAKAVASSERAPIPPPRKDAHVARARPALAAVAERRVNRTRTWSTESASIEIGRQRRYQTRVATVSTRWPFSLTSKHFSRIME